MIAATVLAVVGVACGGATNRDHAATAPEGWSVPLIDHDATWRPVLHDDGQFLLGVRSSTGVTESEEPALVVRRLDPRDGSTVWQTDVLPRGGVPELSVGAGVVLCRQAGAVEAVDARSGSYLWGVRYEAVPAVVGLGGGMFVAVLPGGILDARDIRSGQHLWTLDLSAWEVARLEAVGQHLYAVADGRDERIGEVAVFDVTRPHATPLWHRRSATRADAVELVDDVLVGALDGASVAGYRLRDGSRAFEVTGGGGDRWVGDHRIATQAVDGVALRFHQVDAFAPDADEPAWTTLVPTGSDLVLQQEALGASAILVASAASAALLDAETGAIRWMLPLDAQDAEGRTCSVLGATIDALFLRCAGAGRDVLVAVPVATVD